MVKRPSLGTTRHARWPRVSLGRRHGGVHGGEKRMAHLLHSLHRGVEVRWWILVRQDAIRQCVRMLEAPLDCACGLHVLLPARVLAIRLGSSLVVEHPALEDLDVEVAPIDLARVLLEAPARMLLLLLFVVVAPRLP